MIYGEPETSRFLAALQRLKRQQRKRERQTRQAKQRVRAALRSMPLNSVTPPEVEQREC
jgi:hypothetical protein